MARAGGFEPPISSVTGRRVGPGYTMPASRFARCKLFRLKINILFTLRKFIKFSKGAGGENRTRDLCVMSATLLPTELPRLGPPGIAPGSEAYETSEVLLLYGPQLHYYFNTKFSQLQDDNFGKPRQRFASESLAR